MDLGEDYLTAKTRQRVIDNIKKRADQLGYELVPCMNRSVGYYAIGFFSLFDSGLSRLKI